MPSKLLAAACVVAAVAAGTSAATAAPAPVTTTNAISSGFADTFADPSIIQGRDGYWYAYATSDPLVANGDRKSTRLNSSHVRISYAVFCLKKKKKKERKH